MGKKYIKLDKESFQELKNTLGLKNLHCVICGKKITKYNFGLMNKDFVVCKSPVCMLQTLGLIEETCQGYSGGERTENEPEPEIIDYNYKAEYCITISAENQDKADEEFEKYFIEEWNGSKNIWEIFDISISAGKKEDKH